MQCVHIYAGLQQLLLPVQVVVYIVIVEMNGGLSGEVDARGGSWVMPAGSSLTAAIAPFHLLLGIGHIGARSVCVHA